jgi:hypothetical protein
VIPLTMKEEVVGFQIATVPKKTSYAKRASHHEKTRVFKRAIYNKKTTINKRAKA